MKAVLPRLLLWISCLWLVSGCAGPKKAVWNARVGNYTYDQAVLDMGPPDKNAQLTDGTRVAEWVAWRGGRSGSVVLFGGYPSTVWLDSPSPEVFLRLTFGPDGQLKTWQKVAR